MSDEKTMTFEEFNRGRRPGRVSMFAGILEGLVEREPVAVAVGHNDPRFRRSAFMLAANIRYGSKRVRTVIRDGTLWACLMPDAGNSK